MFVWNIQTEPSRDGNGQLIKSKYRRELIPTKRRIDITVPTKTVNLRFHLDLLETWYNSIPRRNSAGGSRKKLNGISPINYICIS
jgi:hypothetical protein